MNANMEKVLILMQGCPGSGKSTLARMIQRGADGMCSIRETDVLRYHNGVYSDPPELRPAVFAENLRLTACDMQAGVPLIIADKTNIRQGEAQPYIELAQRYGYVVEVVSVTTPLSTCLQRNAQRTPDRKVPEAKVRAMYGAREILLPVANEQQPLRPSLRRCRERRGASSIASAWRLMLLLFGALLEWLR